MMCASLTLLCGLHYTFSLFRASQLYIRSIKAVRTGGHRILTRHYSFSAPVAVGICLLATLFGSGVAGRRTSPANQTKPQNKKDDNSQRLGVLTVRLPITVKEKNKFVGGLAENNFQVFENGKLQRIEGFQAPSQLPLDIAILMDTSDSVKLKLPFEKDAAEDFVSTITTYRRKDHVLFATFDSDVELHQDFTADEEPLITAIKAVKAGGYTKLYDAIYRVIEEKMANLQGTEARRIIVMLSDGVDTASQRNLKDAIEMAQRYDITIFGISTKNFTGITSGMVESPDDKDMRRLCEDTGGQLFLPSQKIELFKAFEQVARDLRQEYVVFYTPDDQQRSGKKRTIRVKLNAVQGHPYYKLGYVY
jgi:Ca-activated chloride channel family protein